MKLQASTIETISIIYLCKYMLNIRSRNLYRTINVLTMHAAFCWRSVCKKKVTLVHLSYMLHQIPDTSKLCKAYIQFVVRLNIISPVCVCVLLHMSVHFCSCGQCVMHTQSSSLMFLVHLQKFHFGIIVDCSLRDCTPCRLHLSVVIRITPRCVIWKQNIVLWRTRSKL